MIGKRCVSNFAASAIASAICIASSGPADAVEPGIHLGVSWEHLKLPETKYGRTFVVAPAFPDQANGTIENDDGKFDGVRIDLAIGGTTTAFLGGVIAAGVKGFYSWYDKNKDTTACQTGNFAVGTIECSNAFPLFDPDPNQTNAFFRLNELVQYRTERDVNHWGVALELQPVSVAGSTKDDPFTSTSSTSFSPKVGLAFRRIDQDLKLAATSDLSSGTVSYREDLETDYWGGYIGFVGREDMGMGWALSVDTEIGLYWADTSYKGQYAASNFVAFPTTVNLNQTLKLDDDSVAVIGALKIGLEKNFGGWTLSGFARGEIITYAPEMAYNDFETVPGGIFTRGANDGTKIDDGTAYTVSAGARVTVPFNTASPSFGSIF